MACVGQGNELLDRAASFNDGSPANQTEKSKSIIAMLKSRPDSFQHAMDEGPEKSFGAKVKTSFNKPVKTASEKPTKSGDAKHGQTNQTTTNILSTEEPRVKHPVSFLKGAADNMMLAREAQERLNALKGLEDVRNSVPVWNKLMYPHRLFREHAQSNYAQNTCVEIWEQPNQMASSATYPQVHNNAESVATWITAACAETTTKNQVVGIYLPRSLEFMASMIGTWYSGAAVCIINSEQSWEEAVNITQDASASLLITVESLVGEDADDLSCPILNVKAAMADDNKTNEQVWLNNLGLDVIPDAGQVSDANIEDDDCCLIMYTDGSNGSPKGVRLQYKAFANNACIEQRLAAPGPQDRVVQTQSLSAIDGFHECWRALASGAALVVANAAVTGLGRDLEAWLREREITIMKTVPSLLRSMMFRNHRPDLPQMRVMQVGGEVVTQDLVDYFGHERLFLHTYGSTETCSNCMVSFCTPGDEECTIGTALPSFKALILDAPDSNEEVSIGELYIGGASLARDYINLDRVTRKSFIQHPKFGRLYKTGDVVERLEESRDIVFRGRRETLTKINGYRIQLAEVEAAMNELPMVKECAAVVSDNTLHAFVTIADGFKSKLSLDALKKDLTEVGLPFFALPGYLTVLEEFPKTLSGKLDRHFIKKDFDEGSKASKASVKHTQSSTLTALMTAISEVLHTQ